MGPNWSKIWIGIVLAAASGCGGPAFEYDSVVTGTVTVDGELAKSGTVTFHPVKEGKAAFGQIHSDGSYSLRTGQGDLNEADGGTVESGEYLVTVSVRMPPSEAVTAEGGPPIAGPSFISSKYAQKSTTDLRYTVKPGPQVIVLNLERAEPQPEQTPEESGTESTGEVETAEGAPTDDIAPADEKAVEESAEPVGDATPPDTDVEQPAAANEQADNAETNAP